MGALLIAHAEVPGPIEHAAALHTEAIRGDPRGYATFLGSRPRAAENEAVALLIDSAARRARARTSSTIRPRTRSPRSPRRKKRGCL